MPLRADSWLVLISVALVLSCGGRPVASAPVVTAPSGSEAEPDDHSATAGPAALPPELAVLLRLPVEQWGMARNGYDAGIPLHSPLRLVQIVCTQRIVRSHPGSPAASAADAAPTTTTACRMVAPAGALRDVPTQSGDFPTASGLVARARACFDVRRGTAPRALLSALELGESMDEISSGPGATLYVVYRQELSARLSRGAGCETAPPDQPCDPTGPGRFLGWEPRASASTWMIDAEGGSHEALIPRSTPLVLELVLMSGPPGAAEVAAAAERADLGTALDLATADVERTREDEHASVELAALSNLATIAFTAGDAAALATATAALVERRSELQSTLPSDARESVGTLVEHASGSIWLGADPCRT